MKPRKKQRIETEGNGYAVVSTRTREEKKKKDKKDKKQKPTANEIEESSEDQGLEEILDDEDELPGTLPIISFLTDVDDEMAIDETDDSEESEQDDFQDVKLKSTSLPTLLLQY